LRRPQRQALRLAPLRCGASPSRPASPSRGVAAPGRSVACERRTTKKADALERGSSYRQIHQIAESKLNLRSTAAVQPPRALRARGTTASARSPAMSGVPPLLPAHPWCFGGAAARQSFGPTERHSAARATQGPCAPVNAAARLARPAPGAGRRCWRWQRRGGELQAGRGTCVRCEHTRSRLDFCSRARGAAAPASRPSLKPFWVLCAARRRSAQLYRPNARRRAAVTRSIFRAQLRGARRNGPRLRAAELSRGGVQEPGRAARRTCRPLSTPRRLVPRRRRAVRDARARLR